MRIVLSSVLTSALLVACSLDWSYPATAAADDAGTVDAGQAPVGDASDGADVTKPNDVDASKPNGGCLTSKDCPTGQTCTFASFDCGAAKEMGTCAVSPGCADTGIKAQYCGCDGSSSFTSVCDVYAKGTDLALCKSVPSGSAGAGYVSCQTPEVVVVDTSLPRARMYRCEAPPGSCGLTACACAQKAYCTTTGGTCNGNVVTCAPK